MTTTVDKNSAIKSALHDGSRGGTSGMTKHKCFGYTHDSSDSLVVHPEEAQVVCWIFERFLAGDRLTGNPSGEAGSNILLLQTMRFEMQTNHHTDG